MTRGCGNDPRTVLTATDAQAVAAFRAYLTARKTVADYEAAPRPVPADAGRLTPAQLALLTAVAHGATQQQLTRRFGVSHPAVSKQLRAARRWLGAETVAHAVFLATRAGLIPDAVGGPQGLSAASEAPGPRRDAAGRSGGDGAGFNGGGKPPSRPGDSRSDPSEAENALRGGSPGLAASARPSLPPGP